MSVKQETSDGKGEKVMMLSSLEPMHIKSWDLGEDVSDKLSKLPENNIASKMSVILDSGNEMDVLIVEGPGEYGSADIQVILLPDIDVDDYERFFRICEDIAYIRGVLKEDERAEGLELFSIDMDDDDLVVVTWTADEVKFITKAQVVKIGDVWVMFYFGAGWCDGAVDRFACSYDLIHWTKWDGPDLIAPSESWDNAYAHKPWVIKVDGVVYHFYCAVGDQGRVIALATSDPSLVKK